MKISLDMIIGFCYSSLVGAMGHPQKRRSEMTYNLTMQNPKGIIGKAFNFTFNLILWSILIIQGLVFLFLSGLLITWFYQMFGF